MEKLEKIKKTLEIVEKSETKCVENHQKVQGKFKKIEQNVKRVEKKLQK